MIILGINAFHADSSASILVDGQLIAAVEEERFNRIKHWAGFPKQSIDYCLQFIGKSIEDVDYIAVNRDPKANFFRKIWYSLTKRPSLSFIYQRLKNRGEVTSIPDLICTEYGLPSSFRQRVHYVEHHLAHLASSFYISGMDHAALLSVDGLGDFSSTKLAKASNYNFCIRFSLFSLFPGIVLYCNDSIYGVYALWRRI